MDDSTRKPEKKRTRTTGALMILKLKQDANGKPVWAQHGDTLKPDVDIPAAEKAIGSEDAFDEGEYMVVRVRNPLRVVLEKPTKPVRRVVR